MCQSSHLRTLALLRHNCFVERDLRTPGQLIDALLREKGWDQKILAAVLGVDRTAITKLVSGKRRVDAEMALALSEAFGVQPERFLELQQSYDLATARIVQRPDKGRADRAMLFGRLPIPEMIQRGWLRRIARLLRRQCR